MSEEDERNVYALETIVIIDDSDEETNDDDAMPQLVDESRQEAKSVFTDHDYGPLPKIVSVLSGTNQLNLTDIQQHVMEESVLNTAPLPLKVQQQPSNKATTGEIISSTPIKTNANDRNVNLAKTQPINGVVSTISNLSKFDGVSTEPQQINESLSVSTMNKSDSLQVNVHYERKLCNISRKKCTGIHINSSDKLSKNLKINSGLKNESVTNSEEDSTEKGNPANQLAYYQKLLKVRSRSSNNNNKLSITFTSDNNNSVRTDDDSDEDCVLMDCTFSCSLCSFTTDKKKLLTEHERNHRRTNHAILRCVYCNQKYTKYALYTHVQNVHPGQKFYISEEISIERESGISASTSTSSLSNTTTQATDMTRALKATKKDRLWHCAKCSYSTSYLRDIKKHEMAHVNGMKLVQCEFCSYISSIHALRAHKRVHLNETPQLSKSLGHTSLRPDLGRNRPASLGSIPIREDSPPLLQLVHEVETKEKPKPKVKCIECHFYAENAEELAEHLKQHSIESVMDIQLAKPPGKTPQTVSCPHCSYVTNFPRDLKRHIITHTPGNVIKKCPNCNYQSTVKTLQAHQRSCQKMKKLAPIVFKTKAKTFTCSECPYSTTLQIKLNKHIKKKHPIPDKVLRCSQCDHTTNNPHHLEQHMKGHKSRMPTFKCSTCDFTGNMFALRHHFMKTGHSMEGRTPLEPPRLTPFSKKEDYQVIEAGAPVPLINDSPPQLEVMVNHNKDVWDQCPKCSYKTPRKGLLKLHLRFHRGNPPLVKCACGYKTVAKCMGTHQSQCTPKPVLSRTSRKSVTEIEPEKLRRTRSSSAKIDKKLVPTIGKPEPERLVKCSKCDFKSTKEIMRTHLKSEQCQIETGAETLSKTNQWKADFRLFFPHCDFQCNDCYVLFKTQFALKQHTLSHQKSGNLMSCNVCGVKSSGNGLAIHRKLHSLKKNEKEPDNFQCETCPFSTPLRIKLNMHKRKHHSYHDDPEEPATKKAKTIPVTVEDSLKCTLCNYTASVPPSVKRHMHFHESNPTWQCPYCKYKGTLHMLKGHPCTKSKNETRDSPFKVTLSCSKCSFTTYTHGELRAHEDTCTKEIKLIKNLNAVKSFKCEYCSFTSFWQYLIDRHKQSHEVLKLPIRQCPNCDFKSTPNALSAHLRNCNPLS